MKSYEVALEIAGPTAMWTRPDSGATPVSAVVPSFSATKGIFESILRWQSVNIVPKKVEICAPIQFHRYATNYGGPLRKSAQISSGSSFQQHAIVLINVCYRLYADATFAHHYEGDSTRRAEAKRGTAELGVRLGCTTCPPHAYAEAFERRLQNGTFYAWPCLGLSDFPANYVGKFRDETKICETENHVITTLLRSTFDRPQNGKWKPAFFNNLIVEKGVLEYKQL